MVKKNIVSAISFIIPALYVLYSITKREYHIFSYSLITMLSILCFVYFTKIFKFMSDKIYVYSLIFILLSVFAGRALRLYGYIPYYDKILHFVSGFLLTFMGKELYIKLKGDKGNLNLLTIFSVCFSISLAGFWEIFEFMSDTLLGTNSQNNSLNDSMLDMILGTVSSVVAGLLQRKQSFATIKHHNKQNTH